LHDAPKVEAALADFLEREAQKAWYWHNLGKTLEIQDEFVIDLHPSIDYGSAAARTCPTMLSSSRLFFASRFREATGCPES
jgi:hypothetical protein